jgi:hypothetical protein
MNDLQDEFERAYVARWSEIMGGEHTADEVQKLRDEHGSYGDRAFLNGCWMGFKMARGVA